jgi:hypothetical protein
MEETLGVVEARLSLGSTLPMIPTDAARDQRPMDPLFGVQREPPKLLEAGIQAVHHLGHLTGVSILFGSKETTSNMLGHVEGLVHLNEAREVGIREVTTFPTVEEQPWVDVINGPVKLGNLEFGKTDGLAHVTTPHCVCELRTHGA